jgi:hypothetical protein
MRFRVALLLSVLACLSAQSRRGAYQQAFQTWRQTDSTLERDAASAGTTLTGRANRVAALAAEYGSERIGYLRAASEDVNQRALALKGVVARPLADLAPAGDLQQVVSTENQVVTTAITSFANDPDRGIQQLRQALDRERAALTALSGAIADRQKAEAKTAQVSVALEQTRTKAGDEYGKLSFGLAQAAGQIDKETSAWASYYQKLASPAAGASLSSVAPVPAPAPAAPANAPAGTPPVPLARYVGAWTFPTPGGQFHGTQPEFVDLVVHEEKGRVTGTLYGRFKLPPGSSGDPVLRFDFDGQLQASPDQTYALVTSDGAKGTIDLIPGPAFNLLEINFQTELKPDKIRLGNFILLKK